MSGGRSETFAGLAGAGDLASAVKGGQSAESRATVSLLGLAFERRGIDAIGHRRPARRAGRGGIARPVA